MAPDRDARDARDAQDAQDAGTETSPEHRPSRVPALVQAAAVGVVLAIVAAVSLTARQPPPPSVAEYAPQAVAQITQAPPEQTVDPNRAGQRATTTTAPGDDGGGADARNGQTTSTTRQVIDKPRVRRCVGDPARQIADPQSPPCVAYFDPKESNGGATSRGVSANEINVAFFGDFFEDPSFTATMMAFFNKRFEFYGRELVMKPLSVTGGVDADPSAMQADAQKAAEAEAFASLNYVGRGGAEYVYYDALADKGIISVAHRVQAHATDAHFRQRSPYQWSVVPTVDSMLRNYGQFVCSTLAGKRPQYAGGVQAGASARRFGLIVQEAADGSRPDTKPLRDELGRCQATPVVEVNNKVTSAAGRTGQGVIGSMTAEDVTSVICLCDGKELRETLMPAASAQAFQPEWLVGSYLDNDLDNSLNGAPPDQAGRALGLAFRNKLLAKQDMPFYWALKEMNGASNPEGGAYFSVAARYSSLLVLSSGIQLAGPNLTPQTFAAGLLRTLWENPNAGAAPSFQARVGFDNARRTFIDDATMIWHDPNRRSTVDPQNTGAVCYVRRGERRGASGANGWRLDDPPFFQQPCL